MKTEIAVLGGGCFWCTEAIFQNLRGVVSVKPGYAGGQKENPTYTQVSSGETGHTEVARIEYNPEKISYHDLLEVFFALHNPTTINQQGNDIGSQYRSIIFYLDNKQKQQALDYIQQLENNHAFSDPIVTEVLPFEEFYDAENYHQNYYESHKDSPYCQFIISPKLAKLRKKFARLVDK